MVCTKGTDVKDVGRQSKNEESEICVIPNRNSFDGHVCTVPKPKVVPQIEASERVTFDSDVNVSSRAHQKEL